MAKLGGPRFIERPPWLDLAEAGRELAGDQVTDAAIKFLSTEQASFREATMADADLLYDWRQADLRAAGLEPQPLGFDAHRDWLWMRIADPLVRVLVWEQHDVPLGMVRVDSNGELAFHAEPRCDAVAMLRATLPLAGLYGGRLKVTLDAADPKAALLEAAGFTVFPATALVYRQ